MEIRDRIEPDRRPKSASIRALAERQHGMVSRSQLLELGLTPAQVTRRIETDRFVAVRRGVYSVGHRQLGMKGVWMSAVLACGPGAVISHRSAAAIWGIMEWIGRAEVLCPGSGKRRGECRNPNHFPPPVVRKSDRFDPRELTLVDAIPVTSVARTLVDLAAVLNEKQLASVLDRAGIRKILDLDDLRRIVSESRGRKGIGKLKSLLERWHPLSVLTRSELETRFLRFLKKIRFDEPLVNVMVAGWEVDFYWPEYDMVVELDGRKFHDTGRGFEADRERNFGLEIAGKKVLRLTWDMVVNQPEATELKLFEYRKMALMTKLDLDHCDYERETLHERLAAENPGWARGEPLWSREGRS